MAAPRQTLTLDVSRRNSARQTLYLGEGDVRGTTLVVTLTEAGKPFGCDGYTPYLMIPTSRSATYRVGGTVSGNIATFVVDESGLGNVNGTLPGGYVSLEAEDGSMTSTQRFNVVVIKSMRDAPAPEQYETDVDDLTGRVEELERLVADIGTPAGVSELAERIEELERRIGETGTLSDDDIDYMFSDEGGADDGSD